MRDNEQTQLVQRIRRGDPAAESELFSRYQKPILWKIRRQLKTGRDNIADLASDICLAILTGLRHATFQPEKWQSLDAYVWGVTNNKIRDWFKQDKRDRNIFDHHPPAEEIAAAAEEYWLETQELRQLLKNCLRTLDDKFKEVLDLRYFQELSVAEISAQLGLPPRRVSERINYALKLLRQAYQKMGKSLSILTLISLLFK